MIELSGKEGELRRGDLSRISDCCRIPIAKDFSKRQELLGNLGARGETIRRQGQNGILDEVDDDLKDCIGR